MEVLVMKAGDVINRAATLWRGWPRGGFALLFSFALMPQQVQADFYKWRDEVGQIHYTQQPPLDLHKYRVEVISIDSLAGLNMPPRVEGGRSYCGRLLLPLLGGESIADIFRLRQAIDRWQGELQGGGNGTGGELDQQGAVERQCAIAYADRQLASLRDIERKIVEDYQQVSWELEDLERELEGCRQTQSQVRGATDRNCREKYQSRISQLKTILHAMEGPKKMLEQGR